MHIARGVSRALFIASIAAVFVASYFHERVFYDDLGSFYNNAYPLRDDDRDYFYIAQAFWNIPHDPKLTDMPVADGKFFSLYPMRGIGAGTPMVALYSAFGFEWRKVFVLGLTFLTVASILMGAWGVYLLFGHGIFSIVFVATLIKFSPGATPDMVQGAEGLVKALLLWNANSLLLYVGLMESRWKKLAPVFGIFLFLGVVYLTLVKTQWWIGPLLAGFLLLGHYKTRKAAVILLFSCLSAFVLVRGINYFHYEKNTEFFSSSGLMSLRLARGPEIVSYGCENKSFPPNASLFLCQSPPRAYTWHEVIRNINPMSEVLLLAEITSKIDKIVLVKNWQSSLKRFWEQASGAIFYLVSPREATVNLKKAIFFLLTFPIFLYWFSRNWNPKGLLLMGFWLMSLVPFFASTLVAPWIERYVGPVCVFFYLVPVMGASDFLFQKTKFRFAFLSLQAADISTKEP